MHKTLSTNVLVCLAPSNQVTTYNPSLSPLMGESTRVFFCSCMCFGVLVFCTSPVVTFLTHLECFDHIEPPQTS